MGCQKTLPDSQNQHTLQELEGFTYATLTWVITPLDLTQEWLRCSPLYSYGANTLI
jgi:hypothetical protein